MDHQVRTIFYRVNTSDVERLTGKAGEYLAKHGSYYQDNLNKVEKWRHAFKELANLDGWHFIHWYFLILFFFFFLILLINKYISTYHLYKFTLLEQLVSQGAKIVLQQEFKRYDIEFVFFSFLVCCLANIRYFGQLFTSYIILVVSSRNIQSSKQLMSHSKIGYRQPPCALFEQLLHYTYSIRKALLDHMRF